MIIESEGLGVIPGAAKNLAGLRKGFGGQVGSG
jgi:hypothetical protein